MLGVQAGENTSRQCRHPGKVLSLLVNYIMKWMWWGEVVSEGRGDMVVIVVMDGGGDGGGGVGW